MVVKKILFIINPKSGGRFGVKLSKVIHNSLVGVLTLDDYDIETVGSELNERIAGLIVKYEKLVIAGGDGTVWHTIARIATLDNLPQIAIIPLGTGNDLARSLGYDKFIKHNGVSAFIQKVLTGYSQQVDVFCINDSIYFTNYLSIGIDAKIANEFNALRKSRWGFLFFSKACNYLAYFILGIKNLIFINPSNFEISGDDVNILINKKLPAFIISNIPSYAGGCSLSDKIEIDDCHFVVSLIENRRDFIKLFTTVFSKTPLNSISKLKQWKINNLQISINSSAFVQVDGEDIADKITNKLTIKHFRKLTFVN